MTLGESMRQLSPSTTRPSFLMHKQKTHVSDALASRAIERTAPTADPSTKKDPTANGVPSPHINPTASKRVAAVGYVRTSASLKAATESIEMQRAAIYKFAAEAGYVVTEIFTDAGFLAEESNRPGFNRLLEAISKGDVSDVIVFDASRLLRSLSAYKEITAVLRAAGARVTDSQGRLLYPSDGQLGIVRAAFHEIQLHTIGERPASGKTAHKGNDAELSVAAPLAGKRSAATAWRAMVPSSELAFVGEIFRRAGDGEPLADIAADLRARSRL